MKYSLDTDNYDTIKLEISEKDISKGMVDVINEFCYGIAAFYTDFASQINCDTEKAKSFKSIFIDCLGRIIDDILDEGVLDIDNSNNTEEVEELKGQLQEAGFSEDEIDNIAKLVSDIGSVEGALEYLDEIIRQNDSEKK